MAVEVAGGHGQLFVLGEVTAKGKVAIEPIVKRLAGDVELTAKIVHQSPEIAAGVEEGSVLTATANSFGFWQSTKNGLGLIYNGFIGKLHWLGEALGEPREYIIAPR